MLLPLKHELAWWCSMENSSRTWINLQEVGRFIPFIQPISGNQTGSCCFFAAVQGAWCPSARWNPWSGVQWDAWHQRGSWRQRTPQNLNWLVVEPSPWKMWKSIGMIITNIWKNKTCSKPPNSKYTEIWSMQNICKCELGSGCWLYLNII